MPKLTGSWIPCLIPPGTSCHLHPPRRRGRRTRPAWQAQILAIRRRVALRAHILEKAHRRRRAGAARGHAREAVPGKRGPCNRPDPRPSSCSCSCSAPPQSCQSRQPMRPPPEAEQCLHTLQDSQAVSRNAVLGWPGGTMAVTVGRRGSGWPTPLPDSRPVQASLPP